MTDQSPPWAQPTVDEESLLDLVMSGGTPDTDIMPVTRDVEIAERVLSQLARLQTTQAAQQAQRAAWQRQLDDWFESANGPVARGIAYLTGQLEQWAIAVRKLDPKLVTHKLPSGTISTRKTDPDLVLLDSQAFIAWCAEHGVENVVEHRPTVNITAIKTRYRFLPATPGRRSGNVSDQFDEVVQVDPDQMIPDRIVDIIDGTVTPLADVAGLGVSEGGITAKSKPNTERNQ